MLDDLWGGFSFLIYFKRLLASLKNGAFLVVFLIISMLPEGGIELILALFEVTLLEVVGICASIE